MTTSLSGKTIAFLATDGVEQVELTEPWAAVEDADGRPELVALRAGEIQGVNYDEKGDSFPVDKTVGEVNAGTHDGLVLPGGTKNPDRLRTDKDAVEFVRAFFDADKPVAFICHGP
jgi:protease I